MVRLVCELGMQLQMRQYGCNGAAVCTFCAAVIVVCFGRFIDMQCRQCGLWYLLCVFHVIVFLDCCKWLLIGVSCC